MGSGAVPELTDQLVGRLADRDEAAIRAAYESLADPLFRFLRSRCGQDELAADIVGETFIELIRSAPHFEGGVEGLRRWLFTAARHNLLDELRKRQRRGEDLAADAASAGDGRDLDRSVGGEWAPRSPEEHVVDGERDAEVRRALVSLPDAQREVLELRFAGELSAAQAGEVMGRSPGAVRVLQHRALKALARALGERHPDADADQVDADLGESAAHAAAARPRGPPTGLEGTQD